ncbi:MAG: tetratricopeptide repeat protein [Gammaproteobacteria bacterium]|nr:tetratricopeptide repeat protein [Gammaproteobacteria bacterium]
MNRGISYVMPPIILLLGACSTIKVSTPVTHPAEVDMRNYKKVAIMEIEGNYGSHYRDRIKAKLAAENSFEVLDCAPIEREVKTTEEITTSSERNRKLNDIEKVAVIAGVLTGQNLGVTTTTPVEEKRIVTKTHIVKEENPACTKEKLLRTALITGKVAGQFTDKVDRESATCTRDKKKYPCNSYTRKSSITASGSIDLKDAESGKLIRSKSVQDICKDSTYATDQAPAQISETTLIEKCANQNSVAFSKIITPWTEYVRVAYKKDGDLPSLEKGINLIKLGKYNEAIATFQDAVKEAESKGLKGNVRAKAYWDLALAYEYSWQFDESLAAIDQAYILDSDDDYLREKANVMQLKQQREKLLQQSSFAEN